MSQHQFPHMVYGVGCETTTGVVAVRVAIETRGQVLDVGLKLASGVERGACMIQIGGPWKCMEEGRGGRGREGKEREGGRRKGREGGEREGRGKGGRRKGEEERRGSDWES